MKRSRVAGQLVKCEELIKFARDAKKADEAEKQAKEEKEQMQAQILELQMRLDKAEQRLPLTCPSHEGMSIIQFCQRCKTFICYVCLKEQHPDHEFTPSKQQGCRVLTNLQQEFSSDLYRAKYQKRKEFLLKKLETMEKNFDDYSETHSLMEL